jgi:hypothetical protein
MNPYTVGGVVLVACGTLLMIWGQLVQSRKDGAAVTSRIEQIREQIASAREHAAGDEKKAIDTVEASFAAWADEFTNKKEAKRVEMERERLDGLAAQVAASKNGIPVYRDIITWLGAIAAAYAKQTKTQIKVDLPPLPENLFKQPYSGYVVFDRDYAWHLMLFGGGAADGVSPPSLVIQAYSMKDKTDITGDALLVDVHVSENRIEFLRMSSRFPFPREMKSGIRLDDYKGPLESALKALFESQVIALEAKP